MEEFQNAHESHELLEARSTHSILVNPQKLSQGLTRTFEGISIIFASLGSKLDVTDLNGRVTQIAEDKATAKETETVTVTATESVEKTEKSTQSEQTETSEHAQSTEPATASKPTEQTEPSEPAKSSISLDDITKVIVEKIKQDRGNREKI